ncbi:hypothetical protein ACS0PU_004330 [Formica fusca]
MGSASSPFLVPALLLLRPSPYRSVSFWIPRHIERIRRVTSRARDIERCHDLRNPRKDCRPTAFIRTPPSDDARWSESEKRDGERGRRSSVNGEGIRARVDGE